MVGGKKASGTLRKLAARDGKVWAAGASVSRQAGAGTSTRKVGGTIWNVTGA